MYALVSAIAVLGFVAAALFALAVLQALEAVSDECERL